MAIQRETRLAELLRRREDLFMEHGPMPTDPANAQKLRQIAVELYELTEIHHLLESLGLRNKNPI